MFIVYGDESGFDFEAVRTHGYSPKGNRCFGLKNWNTKGGVNAIGAILDNKFLNISTFKSSIDSDFFQFG